MLTFNHLSRENTPRHTNPEKSLRGLARSRSAVPGNTFPPVESIQGRRNSETLLRVLSPPAEAALRLDDQPYSFP